jgi:hypothetical protein
MSSFIRDDRGVTEPYTDLPAVGLVVLGILLFGYLICSAYSTYAARSCYADMKDDLRTLAVALSGDPDIACEGVSTILDAQKLENLSVGNDLLRKYGRPGDTVTIEVTADRFRWTTGPLDRVTAGYVLPVTVRLNDARCAPGTMTVCVSEGS